MARVYMAKCKTCGKRVKDPEDSPIYLVAADEYYCSQKCLAAERRKENAK